MVQEILLIEDNPDHAELTLRKLKDVVGGTKISWFKDGQEALDYLLIKESRVRRDSKRLSLILLDIKMPRLDGIDVLRKIKDKEELRRVPVVMLTTSSDSQDIEECYRLGANSFVTKPVKFSELKKCVQEIGSYWLKINTSPGPSINRENCSANFLN